MNPSDLVFDFGWKLNGVGMGEDVARLGFLGLEDTPPSEVQPNLLQRLASRLAGKQARATLRDDQSLVYYKLGLSVEYEQNRIYGYEFYFGSLEEFSPYAGRFVSGTEALELNSQTSFEQVLQLFGTPTDQDEDRDYLSYVNEPWDLSFWFSQGKLESIEAYWDGE